MENCDIEDPREPFPQDEDWEEIQTVRAYLDDLKELNKNEANDYTDEN